MSNRWIRGRWIGLPLLLVVCASPAAAQFGVKGGVNLSRFVGEDAASESDLGLNLGASVPLFSLGPVSIVPEIYYAQKGGGQFDPASSQAFEFDLSYIEVPLLARLRIPLSGPLGAYVGAGPVYAWQLDCKFTAQSDPSATARECGEQFQSFDSAMKSADKGIVVNAGLDLPLLGGFGGLNIDARLVRGLDRIVESDAGMSVKNQAITLMLGYYLGM